MPRRPRILYPGAIYHVYQRGQQKQTIFRDKKDCLRFLSYISRAYSRHNIIIHAYCLMGNHYHLLMETPEANLSEAMHALNVGYANYFVRRHQWAGHVYQGRFNAILVGDDHYFRLASRYIHRNPVVAGFVKKPQAFEWSSAQYYFDRKTYEPLWLSKTKTLSVFSKNKTRAKKVYTNFLLQGQDKTYEEYLTEMSKEEEIISFEYNENPRRENEEELKQKRIEQIKTLVEEKVMNKSDARKILVYCLCKHTSLKMREVALMIGCSSCATVGSIVSRIERRDIENKKFKNLLDIVVKKLS